jgi:hypothetical protein
MSSNKSTKRYYQKLLRNAGYIKSPWKDEPNEFEHGTDIHIFATISSLNRWIELRYDFCPQRGDMLSYQFSLVVGNLQPAHWWYRNGAGYEVNSEGTMPSNIDAEVMLRGFLLIDEMKRILNV